MKKYTAIILALVFCLLLNGCSREEKSVDNTVQHGTSATEHAVQNKENQEIVCQFDGTATGDVTIEEVVVRPHTVGHDGTLFFNWEMKVRNTSDADTVPDETVMRVWFRYLDKNGDIIENTLGEAGKNSPVKSGQAEWIQMNGRLGSMDSREVEAAAFIEIYAYTKTPGKGPETYYESPILIDIQKFSADSPEETAKNTAYRFDGTATGDVTVEEVSVKPHTVGHDGSLFFNWEMKVRNTSAADTIPDETVMRIWLRYLDENRDIIADTLGEAGNYSSVKSGQAEWIQMNGRLGGMDSSEVEATAFIEIYGYTQTPGKKPEVFYDEPILIDIREFVSK